MHRKKRLPIGLISRQNGDPRFIPPVSFGADYAKQVLKLKSTVTALKDHVVLQTQKAQRQADQITVYIERLKELRGKNVEKLQNELEKCRAKNTADLAKNDLQAFDLKGCKSQLAACKAEQTRLNNEHKRLLAQGKTDHGDELAKLKIKEDALGSQIDILEVTITDLKTAVNTNKKYTDKRDTELAKLKARLGDLLRAQGNPEGGAVGKRGRYEFPNQASENRLNPDGSREDGAGAAPPSSNPFDDEDDDEYDDDEESDEESKMETQQRETKEQEDDGAAAAASSGMFSAYLRDTSMGALDTTQVAADEAAARRQAALEDTENDRLRSRRQKVRPEGKTKLRRTVPSTVAKQQSEHQVPEQLKLLSLHKLRI